ncbi:hypothetical protein [Bernardetia sp. MNP-M8]|uniref:hypothetical protein n=1 Tax=Bernardetia sp. MNP-M8 TaxID=3127470 RepID=UPI0030CF7BB0
MTYTHTISSETHQDFLNQDRTDPITGEKIEEGHTIVICAACKSAFFIESWQYLNESHCEQFDTLKEIPISKNLFLEAKPMEFLNFGFAYRPMYVPDSGLKVLGFLMLVVSPILFPIVGIALGWAIAILFFLSVIGFIGWIEWHNGKPLKLKNPTRKQIENTKSHLNIGVNLKKQGIVIKEKDNKEKLILFENINELKYFINYHPTQDLSSKLFCQLKLRIEGYTVITYYATIHKETIPEWSKFISQLPYNLRVINTDF